MITSTHQATTLTDLLSHLVRMPTVSADHATNRAALDWIQEQLRDVPLDFKTITHNNVSCLVATTPKVKNPKRPKLWLYGHLDVVPGTPGEFKPRVSDGRIYGRGVFDMKYGIAVYIKLLKELGEDLADYDLGLMLVTDEEISGRNGAGHLASLGYLSQTMLLPECGTPWSLETGGKGVSWWKATATGQSGHAARPWLGSNAINRLTSFLAELNQIFAPEPCGDDEHMHNSVNVGTIIGGAATNQIPGLAEATFDIRLMPDTSTDELTATIEKIASGSPGIRIEQLMLDPAFKLPSDGSATLFESITRDITGRQLTRTFATGSSDARFFASRGTQVITVPTTGGGQHSPDEWIDIEDLNSYYEIVSRFVNEYAGPEAKN